MKKILIFLIIIILGCLVWFKLPLMRPYQNRIPSLKKVSPNEYFKQKRDFNNMVNSFNSNEWGNF